jgi:hypothetical protein
MQIGLDPRSVVLSDVSAGQEKFIDALYYGFAPNQLEALAKQSKLPLAEAQQLVEQLDGLLERQRPFSKPPSKNGTGLSVPAPVNLDSAFAEIVRASLRHSSNGQQVLLERARRAVHIDVLDGTGVMLAQALVAAGVGTIVSHDSGVVTQFDVGTNAFPQGLLGHARIDALRLMVEASVASRVVSGSKLREVQLAGIDAAVVIGQQVIDPKRYSIWLSRGVNHLAIRFEATAIEVSPLIVLGKTACLHCQQLWLQERDPDWAVMNSQLQTSVVRFDSGANRLIACGLAAQTILAALDAEAGYDSEPNELCGFRFEQQPRNIEQVSWPIHADCSCSLVSLQQVQEA